jgi:hypothetical protein
LTGLMSRTHIGAHARRGERDYLCMVGNCRVCGLGRVLLLDLRPRAGSCAGHQRHCHPAPTARAQGSPQLGSDALVLEGRLLPSTPDSLVIAASHVARLGERGEMWRGERVALPLQFVARVQRRRVSVPRTTLVSPNSRRQCPKGDLLGHALRPRRRRSARFRIGVALELSDG